MVQILLYLSLACFFVGNSSEKLKVLANAYAANFEATDRGRLTIGMVEGRSNEEESASRGEIDDPVHSEIDYLYQNNYKLYIHTYRSEDVIRGTTSTGSLSTSTRYNPIQMATNGVNTVIDLINLPPKEKTLQHRVVFQKDGGLFEQRYQLPLNLGFPRRPVYNFATDVETARVSPELAKVQSVKEGVSLEGVMTIEVVFRAPGGERIYWLDPARGCVPLKILERDESRKHTFTILNQSLKYTSDKFWLPYTIILYFNQSKQVKKFDIRRFNVNDGESWRDLKLTFPEETAVVDTVNNVRHNKSKSFQLANFMTSPPPRSRPIKVMASAPAPELPGETSRQALWAPLIYWALAGGLLLIVVYRVYRQMRSKG